MLFMNHDEERFTKYLEDLKKRNKEINSSVLYPYNLVSEYISHGAKYNEIIEQQWKSLPNYIKDDSNILVIPDISSSMIGKPMNTSIGLAIYFAERNKGLLEGVYMTFGSTPHFEYIEKEQSFYEKVTKINNIYTGYSINLKAAFDYLLNIAEKNNFTKEDIPSAICVISDMKIDRYMNPRYKYDWDFVKTQKMAYEEAGYSLPKLILWNVDARGDTFLSQSDNVIFISGQSPSSFKSLINNLNGIDEVDIMLNTLNDEICDCIRV